MKMIPRPWRKGCGECGEAATHSGTRGYRCWSHAEGPEEPAPAPDPLPLQGMGVRDERLWASEHLPPRPSKVGECHLCLGVVEEVTPENFGIRCDYCATTLWASKRSGYA